MSVDKQGVLTLICRLEKQAVEQLKLIESLSHKDLYSDIVSFLKSKNSHQIFFQMESKDLNDFFLLCLSSRKLLGFWALFLLNQEIDVPKQLKEDSEQLQLTDSISDFQRSDYFKSSVKKDFPIISAFSDFKKTRLRLNSVTSKTDQGRAFYKNNLDTFQFLWDVGSVKDWLNTRQMEETNNKSSLYVAKRTSDDISESFINLNQSEIKEHESFVVFNSQ